MPDVCENFAKCPIYSGVLKDKQFSAASYKKNYCEAGSEGWKKCKRYQVKQRTGKCPPDLLPNSTKSVDEIVAGLS